MLMLRNAKLVASSVSIKLDQLRPNINLRWLLASSPIIVQTLMHVVNINFNGLSGSSRVA